MLNLITGSFAVPFQIPCDHKFALLALHGFYRTDLTGRVQLREGLSVELEPLVNLPEHWLRWLGEIAAERLSESRFFLLMTAQSNCPGILDAENKALEDALHNLYLCLMIHAIPNTDEVLFIEGARQGDEVTVRGASRVTPYRFLTPAGPEPITEDSLRRAAAIENGLSSVFNAQFSLPTTPLYRLRLGLVALMYALHEKFLPERVHQLCRAIEAVIAPRKGHTTKDFTHRCRTFASGADVQQVIQDIYELRNAYEHLHMRHPDSFKNLSKDEAESRTMLRAFQAEQLARHVYARLLADTQLLQDIYGSEMALQQFWATDDGSRQRKWGKSLDLDYLVASNAYLRRRLRIRTTVTTTDNA